MEANNPTFDQNETSLIECNDMFSVWFLSTLILLISSILPGFCYLSHKAQGNPVLMNEKVLCDK